MKFAGLGANDEFVRASNLLNVAVQNNLHSCGTAFGFEHFHDILRGAVAEKLAERLLVIRNVVFFNQRDEVRRFVPGQGGFREVGIRGIEVFRPAMEVGEIAAASAGDEDLFTRAIGPFQDGDAAAAFARLDRAHQPGGSGAQNYRIKFVDHDREASIAKPGAENDYYIPGWNRAGIAIARPVLEFQTFAMSRIDFVDWTFLEAGVTVDTKYLRTESLCEVRGP